jgi:hypothetical protein
VDSKGIVPTGEGKLASRTKWRGNRRNLVVERRERSEGVGWEEYEE